MEMLIDCKGTGEKKMRRNGRRMAEAREKRKREETKRAEGRRGGGEVG